MTPTQYQLLQTLQHGPRSGPQLGAELRISRAAVWKHIEQLRAAGVAINSSEHGYGLPPELHLLDSQAITAQLHPAIRELCTGIDIVPATDSTNTDVWQLPSQRLHGHVILAEWQRAGRGRRGRQWYSPPCSNIYFSLGWRFDCGVGALGLLSTQVAVSTAQAIDQVCGVPVQLKWPNDIYLNGCKLGGILIELQATPDGPSSAVLGIGINVHLPPDAPIDQAYTSLSHAMPHHGQHGATNPPTSPDRNHLVAALINHLCPALNSWPLHDHRMLLQAWRQRDFLHGQTITVSDGHHHTHGRYLGIDNQGGLRLQTDQEEHSYHSGEVSVRKV